MDPLDISMAALRIHKADLAHKDSNPKEWNFATANASDASKHPPSAEIVEGISEYAVRIDATPHKPDPDDEVPPLPKLLLPQLSPTCMEVLIWLGRQQERNGGTIEALRGLLRSLAIWWTLFVKSEDKASRLWFLGIDAVGGGRGPISRPEVKTIIEEIVRTNYAYHLLSVDCGDSVKMTFCSSRLLIWEDLFNTKLCRGATL